MTSSDMERWMTSQGIDFLKNIGMKSGQVVLDFGCKHGTYAIPAAMVVGEHGTVYAVDKSKDALHEIANKAGEKELKNIERIAVTDQIKLLLSDESVDLILLYDVLHLVESRERLLAEFYRVSKPLGILSVYPKHHEKDMNMDLDEVKEEIETMGFRFEKKGFKTLMHDDHLEQDYILNFRKS